jgi:adenylate cyclase
MAVEPEAFGTRPGVVAARPESAEAHLSRYLPRCVHAQLGHSRPRQRRPGVSRFDGVVLLTDLAGFSRMTDQFSAQGPEGVEQLSRVLDTYFGSMTEIALEHGGDVVDFVGDAIVVMWPDNGDLSASAAAAVACGLALQGALKDVAQATGLNLQQRVSIGAGELLQFTVGGADNKWRWLLAGAPMRQAGACNHLARPGQVLVCDSAWALVREHCRGQLLDSGHAVAERVHAPAAPWRAMPQPRGVETQAQLEEFVAQPLLERFQAGHWDWLGEFRNICAVFIGLPQLDLAAPGAPEQVQEATACAQREVTRYGGSLQSVVMDDKGITLFAAFGLPGHSHEDDCVRAVRAVLSLESWLKEHGIACSAGITHGRAFYGDSGGPRRRHVTLIGGVVNLAARLMQTAPGGVLCDEATCQRAARALSFSPAPAQRVKDQAEPLAVFTPGAADEVVPSAHDNAIIGRTAERQRIGKELDRLVAGHSGLLLLCGEAGIGKSRLLREALRQARRRALRVLASPCSAVEAATPYFAWRRLLQQMLLGERPFDAAAARQSLRQRLQGETLLEPWQPLLNDILPLQLEDNVYTQQMESGARASSLRALLLHLLRGLAAERPVVLLVDDLHWCDDASATILAEAVEAVPRLLLLAGTRPLHSGAAEAAVKLLRNAQAQTLQLDLLPREELDQLACHKLGVPELPPELGEFLYNRTAGNPFYSEELLLALRGAGLVELQDGRCRLSPDFGRASLATLPTTLQGVIISRVDQLGPAEQLTLKLISVIGREFSLPMLRRLHPVAVDAAGLEAIVARLLQADIVRPATAGAPGEFIFKHAILREVIYDLLPYAQRRQFHRDIALWIESHGTAQLEPHYAELALHWEKAGEVDKAIAYLERAGALAFGRFANRLAIQHIHRAYSLAQRHGIALSTARIAACEGILGDSHQELFEYNTAALHFKRCLARIDRPPAETTLRLCGGLLRELLLQLRLRLGRGGPATQDPRVRRAAHIYQRLAESSFFDNRPLQLLYEIIASVNLAERSGATREIVDGFGAIAVVAVAAGLRRASHFYNQRSMEVTRAANPMDAAYGYLVDMVYWATLGGWAQIERSCVSGEAIYRQLGGAVRWQQTQSITYTALNLQGRFDDALAVLQRARAAMSVDVPAQVLSFWYCSMLDVALVRGLPLEPLIAGLEAAQEPGLHRSDRMRSLGLIARARQCQGQRVLALTVADQALELIRQSSPTPWHIGDGIAAAAEVYMDEWESGNPDPRLLQRAGEVCKALRGFAQRVPVGRPPAELQYGRYLRLRGRHRAALKWLRRAEQSAALLCTTYEQGRALHQLGLIAEDAAATAQLRQALAIFQRIGAPLDAEHCATALARRGASAAG